MEVKSNYDGVVPQGLLVAAFFGLSYVLKGFVLRKLWLWFITPTFNCAVPNLAIAIGLVLIVGLFGTTFEQFVAASDSDNLEKRAHQGGLLLNHLFMRPMVIWFFGYCIHLLA